MSLNYKGQCVYCGKQGKIGCCDDCGEETCNQCVPCHDCDCCDSKHVYVPGVKCEDCALKYTTCKEHFGEESDNEKSMQDE